jgi:hypothetical protein
MFAYVHFFSFKFGFGNLMDDFRGHLFFYSLSFNFETLGLDVKGCWGLTCNNIVGT